QVVCGRPQSPGARETGQIPVLRRRAVGKMARRETAPLLVAQRDAGIAQSERPADPLEDQRLVALSRREVEEMAEEPHSDTGVFILLAGVARKFAVRETV